VPRTPEDPEARFWRFVSKSDGCWLWTGTVVARYGQFRTGGQGSKKVRAHRYSYVLAKGHIPDGVLICHTCDVPLCVNPDHLYEGDSASNMADRSTRGRTASGDRSGARQHPQSVARGSRQGSARLDERKVLEILLRREAGESEMALATSFGVDRKTINGIVNRKFWRHVPWHSL
jgi:hypothetical protein